MSQTEARPTLTTTLGCMLQFVGGGLGWSLVPPLLPEITAELGLDARMAGLAWGAAPLGIALASIIGGAVVDRYGPRRVAGIAMLFGAALCAGRAVAVGPWSFIALMFGFGLHIGFVAPSVPKALAGHVAPQHVSRANGLTVLCYTLGTALTVLFARTYISPLFGGWRVTMAAAGAAMAITGVLWLLFVTDRAVKMAHAGLGDVLRLGLNGQLRRVAAIYFLVFGGYLALLGMLIPALLSVGLSRGQAVLAVAAWLMFAALANFVGPLISDRIGLRRPLFILGSVVAGTSLLILAAAPGTSTVWLLAVAALGGGCFAPLVVTMPLEIEGIGPARAGAAIGLLMLVGQVGGFLLPVMTGQVTHYFSFAGALAALAVVHLAIVIPVRGLIETGRAAKRAEPSTVATAAELQVGAPADLPLVDGEPLPTRAATMPVEPPPAPLKPSVRPVL